MKITKNHENHENHQFPRKILAVFEPGPILANIFSLPIGGVLLAHSHRMLYCLTRFKHVVYAS